MTALEEPLRKGCPASDRTALAQRFREIRSMTESLCAPLETEDYVVQSMPDASPAKWHLAHTTWFFETFVLKQVRSEHRDFHPQYSFLFNSYYNAAGPMHCRPRRGMISRPTVSQTRRYRQQVDAAILDVIDELDEDRWCAIYPTVVLGLHHEQQHQELLLTDLKHLLAQNPLKPVYLPRAAALSMSIPPIEWIDFGEGLHWIGHDVDGFAFDNEEPRHREFLNAFQLASRLVTNGEYIEFMEDDGYKRPEFWLSLGWFAVNEQSWRSPLYWEKRDNAWHAFTLSGFRPVDPHEPLCHVSYFEADAFARWASARLPTEAEWEVAAARVPVRGNFVESSAYHPIPRAPNDQAPLSQMFGDVWEWTRSSYAPYPGYSPPPGAIGEYNGKFMCNQYVLRGGSCATSQTHIRPTYRNFFPPDKRWQFSGIRLARDLS